MKNEKVSLRLPASAEFGRVARAAAANLATRLGWQAVDIDSLRLAIDEAVAVLVDDDSTGDLTLDFLIIDDGMELTIAAADTRAGAIPAERLSRFESLVAPGFAQASVDATARSVHVVKRVR